ncbi:hypothetical protein IW262DRAFT_1486681 [Armillaria fumosa]|nr:hypothetical protein IW262DRAFT_1486681 [Armillaria fumosa]
MAPRLNINCVLIYFSRLSQPSREVRTMKIASFPCVRNGKGQLSALVLHKSLRSTFRLFMVALYITIMSEDQAGFDYLGAILNQEILGALSTSLQHGQAFIHAFCYSPMDDMYIKCSDMAYPNKHDLKPKISWPLSLHDYTSRRQSSWHLTGLMVNAYFKNDETYVTALQALASSLQAQAYRWVSGITSGIDTDIADTIMICRDFKDSTPIKEILFPIRSGAVG